ncbi:MAG: hypothetical protein WA843_02750 [Candidatus Saccharimonadales bacterium]
MNYKNPNNVKADHYVPGDVADVAGGHIGDPVGSAADKDALAFDQLADRGTSTIQRAANGDVTKVTVIKAPNGSYEFEQTREQRGGLDPVKAVGAAALASDGKVVDGVTLTEGKSLSDTWHAEVTSPRGGTHRYDTVTSDGRDKGATRVMTAAATTSEIDTLIADARHDVTVPKSLIPGK